MNLERTKPETLAAAALDLTPSQSLAAHEYAERLNAALARLGLTDRLTLPPAPNTAIDELPAVVDVPLRKTLQVLMGKAQQGDASALATLEMAAQVMESIFAGLHARASVYPLALPSHESLATLSQGVDALLPRKISTGWSVASLLADPTCDGIDDGVSLVRLLCSDAADSVTELKDDNEGWVMDKSINLGTFPNIKHITIRAKTIDLNNSRLYSGATSVHINLPNATYIYATFPQDNSEIYAPEVESLYQLNGYGEAPQGEIVYMPKLRKVNCNNHYFRWFARDTELPTRKMVFGSLQGPYGLNNWGNCTSPNLIHLEFGADGMGGLAISMDTSTWWNPSEETLTNPIFLSNFKTYIAERLSEKGSGKTLTLSQAVRDAIEGDPTIAQIITSKGWSISPAPSV